MLRCEFTLFIEVNIWIKLTKEVDQPVSQQVYAQLGCLKNYGNWFPMQTYKSDGIIPKNALSKNVINFIME